MAIAAQLRIPPERFQAALLRWFDRHRRDLPWRNTRDPYRIWVSEIMLQQTRVAAVVERYGEFLRRYPSVRVLAAARPADVLAAWSGLGYYRRARAVHQAARLIVRRYDAHLPTTAAGLLQLPGIGRYTAAAIASIAFGERCAVLDGNVERVLRRVLAQSNGSTATLWHAAEHLLSRARPGDFNQAMMEIGATVCLPLRPRCAECPVRRWCATREDNAHPVAPKSGIGPPLSSRKDGGGPRLSLPGLERQGGNTRRKVSIAYGLSRRGDSVYLVRRSRAASLMPGMWELPEMACGTRALACALAPAASPAPLFTLRHNITVTDYLVGVHEVSPDIMNGGRWVRRKHASGLPLTGLARKILQRAKVI